MKTIDSKHMRPFMEIMEINKQVSGLEGQKDKHEVALKNIRQLIKDLKANRTKTLKQIVGGTLITEIDGKNAIKMLQERKKEMEIGLKSLDEQLMHRRDGLESAAIRAYKFLRKRVPDDILEEIEG